MIYSVFGLGIYEAVRYNCYMSWKSKQVTRKDRTGKIVGIRWEFRRYNPINKRYDRVPIYEVPIHIRYSQDIKIVQEFCKLKNAEANSLDVRKRVTIEWKEKYPNFELLLKEFILYQTKRAPNSWQTDCHYFERYVMRFFLERSLSDDTKNVLNWSLYYQEFLAWLSVEKPLKCSKDKLALNTQNRVIKSLNVFLTMIGQKTGQEYAKCPTYSREDLNQVTAQDIYLPQEVEALKFVLKEIRLESYYLFIVLVNTALRINEALGLPMSFVHQGHLSGVSSAKLHEQLTKYELGEYNGYICLESQPAVDSIRTNEVFKDRWDKSWQVGSVPRKPLKSRRRIDPKWFRFIPIFNNEAWKVLATLYNTQIDLYEKRTHGNDERDYLLFDKLTASMFYQDLIKASESAKIRFRSPHKLRHTFLTWFYARTNEDRLLARKVGGHEDERSMLIYSHLAEQIGLEQKSKEQLRAKIEL